MKRLILFELMILFLATTFESDSPPGWFQQVLPRTDVLLSDIYFIDTANGWAVGQKYPSNDTAFVYRTINSGTNWNEQYRLSANFSTIQFLDVNTGYIAGGDGFGRLFKTTNTGTNWNLVSTLGFYLLDLFFINKDTGWVCDPDATFGAGLQKTTNGGVNWFQQLPRAYKPMKLFFINKDTGWTACNFSGVGTGRELYRTTNGGTNWSLQFTSAFTIEAIFFLTPIKGWMRGGPNVNNVKSYTTDGGINWISSQGYPAGGYDLKFINDSIGFSGGGFNEIAKSTDGGKTWGYQNTPNSTNLSIATLPNESLKVWQSRNGVIHTTDGGGSLILGVNQISTEMPSGYKLFQNYPNPFNPTTNIKYIVMSNVKHQTSNVKLIVYDITGREAIKLVDKEQNAGTYVTDWNASGFSSGIYFYSLIIDEKQIETKKMILLK